MIGASEIDELFGEVRVMARRLLRSRACRGGSIGPTELALTALRRAKGSGREWAEVTWSTREAFFALMHRAMLTALVDRARRSQALKRRHVRATDPSELDFRDLATGSDERPDQILALEEALEWLEEHDSQLGTVVRHHYFTGLGVDEIADLMEMSSRTVKRRLAEARMLLHRRILQILNVSFQSPA